MSYQKQPPAPQVSRQNSCGNHSNLIAMPLVNLKEQTLLWQQNSCIGDSGIPTGPSTHATESLCRKENQSNGNSTTVHWHQPVFGHGFTQEQVDDCYDNNPSDMPLVNAKEQTLLWQQNSYLVDSGIHSGASSHASSSLCGKEGHFDNSSIASDWQQPGFQQDFSPGLVEGSLGNPTSSPDMPSTNSKQQNIPWKQNSYLMDSDIQAGVSTYAQSSLLNTEDHLNSNSVASQWQQPGFQPSATQDQVEEFCEHLNQIQSQRMHTDVFPETSEVLSECQRTHINLQHQFDPSQMLELAILNLIEHQDAVDLVKLLNCQYQAVVREVTVRVYQLSKENSSLHIIMNLPQLVSSLIHAMISSNDLNITVPAVGALHNLSLHQQGLQVIYRCNGIPALVTMLSSGVERVLNYAITTLHNLLLHEEGSITAVCLAGGLHKMTALLQCNNAQFLAVVTDCLRILAYANQEIKLTILASGCSIELIRIMRYYTYDILLCNTSSLLRSLLKSLSMCSRNKLEIIEAGGIQALAKHLTHQNRRLVLNCLWSLRYLSDAATKQDNVQELLQSLVHLLKNGNTEIVTHASYILCNMTCNEHNKVTVCHVGGIEALIHAIIQAGDAEEITEPAVCALRHITVNHPEENMAQNAVRSHNGIQVLVKLLHPPSRWPLIKAVIGLIRNLALCTSNHVPLREYGAIPRLVQLLTKAYQNIQRQQSNATLNMSKSTLVDGVTMEEIIKRTLEILNNLAQDAHSRTVIRTLNVIPIFKQLLYSDIENIHRMAADVLCKLASDNPGVAMIKEEYTMSYDNSHVSQMLFENSREHALPWQQNLYMEDSGIHSRSSTYVPPTPYEKEDSLNSVPVKFEPVFGIDFAQKQMDATYADVSYSQVPEGKFLKCKERLSVESSNSVFRDNEEPWTRMPAVTDINDLGPREAHPNQLHQGNQRPPTVHSGMPKHNSSFDFKAPVDSMQDLDLGKLILNDGCGSLYTTMDFDNLLEANFDIDPMLPASSQDNKTMQLDTWYNTNSL